MNLSHRSMFSFKSGTSLPSPPINLRVNVYSSADFPPYIKWRHFVSSHLHTAQESCHWLQALRGSDLSTEFENSLSSKRNFSKPFPNQKASKLFSQLVVDSILTLKLWGWCETALPAGSGVGSDVGWKLGSAVWCWLKSSLWETNCSLGVQACG